MDNMNNSKQTPQYGNTNPTPNEIGQDGIKRIGSVIGLRDEFESVYRSLHANVWPSVMERLKKSNVENFSIFITELEGTKYLFSYFEYTGTSFEVDMQAIADDPETQRWWKETDPCQFRLPSAKPNDHWSVMESVCFMK